MDCVRGKKGDSEAKLEFKGQKFSRKEDEEKEHEPSSQCLMIFHVVAHQKGFISDLKEGSG